MVFDVHFHLRQFLEASGGPPPAGGLPVDYRGLVSCHDREDWHALEQVRSAGWPGIHGCFGLHPQWPVMDHADFMAELAASGRLTAVGECGFDFFEGRNAGAEELQERLFLLQVDLALRHDLPLVVHLRKGTDMIFRHRRVLKRLRGLIFHSWPGPANEARDLLGGGINAYFSFGTTVLWNARKPLETLRFLAGQPDPRILVESDMPWQPPRDRPWTGPAELGRVVARVAELAGLEMPDCEELLEANLSRAGLFS